ncbi:unnamed protein product [Parascedosporium putredinis]|uniref:Major facilitator superfamily (MFS) profile domain-containing protein n=1 Tax=Parascedosporium putredinis TaxID=1442378 RepID=A0A9P1H089_9PEZI|nr:unnamed protein product [Parascedosporium putredinis]CAI7993638.1 unnamed protein product [Parascedosporium putredinis]
MGRASTEGVDNYGNGVQEPPVVDADVVRKEQKVTFKACLLGGVASIGGFMFGYVSGQISGFFLMQDYGHRFGEADAGGGFYFSAARQGAIVGLLSVGCLFGSLLSGKMADIIGRKLSISIAALIGALSVLVPMYQSECSPAIIRGILVASYQLFVTLGIWTAEMVNWGTESRTNSASWRIPNEPRYAYRKGRRDEARLTMAKLAGADPHAASINKEVAEIQEKLDAEKDASDTHWHEIFTGPRMFYRTALGMVLQAGQQLTGVNYFFYYGTTAFQSTGISNSYTTQLILGSVNVVCTIAGLWVVANVGRRKALMAGAAWMMVCFLIYAFVGHFALDRANPMNTPDQVVSSSRSLPWSLLGLGYRV